MITAIVGPSGAGKDLLIAGALAAWPDLRLARRVITRPSDAGAEDFEGVTAATFARMRDQGRFALHWQAHGLSYGIPHDPLSGPGPVIFNGSRAALPQAVAQMPGLRVVLVTAPEALLAARLAARGREAKSDIAARLDRAGFAMPEGIAHATVINDRTPQIGIARLLAALRPETAIR
ncbi:phosphonate metabolism protein/1,5-bisphosphokinase (PRPP-forming) PhnN [Paracoccus nototheniae]|uniref:Phosphonate metabolism protein/1,5-bisphosphokinase (PRPP-forming) PhnN n=1 Tax=Paracoccus nototheniae TaxID=2489002 RepID=A0ABW4E2G7_9RHOB|nr:phosphonate metabolism protein/1,5-bisphosphokinase (PRPP-forming) PhnN [Paracoccus nototheniae]